MMQIAICDDDVSYVQQLRSKIEEYFTKAQIENTIEAFTDAPSFLSSPVEDYDIVFLDVKIGDVNGLDVARQWRKRNSQAILVFISALVEFAPEGYEVTALRYLVKNSQEELGKKLTYCLDDALQLFRTRERIKIKTTDGKVVTLSVSEIWFIESNNHHVIFHTTEGTYSIYDTLSKVAQRITSPDFMQIHRSYFANMRNAISIHGYTLSYPLGKEAAISQQNKEAVWTRFMTVQGEC